jgi:hypothetical protein
MTIQNKYPCIISLCADVPSLEKQSANTVLSVQFYYTPEFAAITSDITGYMDGLVSNANAGYSNSQGQ